MTSNLQLLERECYSFLNVRPLLHFPCSRGQPHTRAHMGELIRLSELSKEIEHKLWEGTCLRQLGVYVGGRNGVAMIMFYSITI